MKPIMIKKLVLNLFIEFGPIISFLVASEILDFIPATGIFIFVTVISLLLSLSERKKITYFPLIAGATVIGSGLLTIIFDNPFFLIIKDTIYNGTFSLILFIGIFYKKGLLKKLFNELFSLTDKGWYILSKRWAIFFLILAILNEFARQLFVPQVWVIYKGLATVATIIFSLYQFRLSKKERLPEASEWGLKIIK